MLCGLVSFIACIVALTAVIGGMPSPEVEGRLLFSCLAPAMITGLVVKGRCWSWVRIASVYTVAAVALLMISAPSTLRGMEP
jgi:hypothetical protein